MAQLIEHQHCLVAGTGRFQRQTCRLPLLIDPVLAIEDRFISRSIRAGNVKGSGELTCQGRFSSLPGAGQYLNECSRFFDPGQ
jgi:hypothetical protein